MFLPQWRQQAGRSGSRRLHLGPRTPRVEVLEDRLLPSFLPAVNYNTGPGPRDVAVGDFLHDGHLDLAVANSGSNTVSVLRGNGDGTFQSAVNYPAGSSPIGLAVGDFTGNGVLDLAVTASNDNNVNILLGNGDGSFRAPVSYPVGPNPLLLKAAEFTGNGVLDLAVANYGGNTVSVLLGNGNGTFRSAVSYTTDSGATSVAVGDFNGDGKPDLAVSNLWANDLSVLLGRGDGTFQPAGNYSFGSGLNTVVAADLNGDGVLDLATAPSAANSANVLLGRGDGTFQTPVSYPVGGAPTAMVVGDFTGDGLPDLAVSYRSGVSVLLGRGNGTFAPAMNFAVGSNPFNLTEGDFAGNGRLDLAVTNLNSNTVSVLVNDGNWPQYGTFAFSGLTQAIAGATASVTVSARLHGAIDTGYTGTVHFTSSDARAGLPLDYTFTPDDHGQHTFPVLFRTVGTQSISATDATGNFLGTSDPISVTPGPTSAFAITGLPANPTAGSLQTFTVHGVDSYGNFTTDYVGTVHFTSSDPQAGLPGDYTFTAGDHGGHGFAAVLRTAGTQSVTVGDTSDPTLTGTQGGIAVQAAAANRLLVSGFPDTVAGQTGTFTVTAEDPYDNVAAGYTGTVRFTSSDPRAILPGVYTFTAADRGNHFFGAELDTAGIQALTTADSFNPTITGLQGRIVVSPAALHELRVSGFPASSAAGSPQTVTVAAVDAYGNTVPTWTGLVTFSSSDPQAVLPDDYLFTDADQGRHTFGAVLATAGPQSLTATDIDTGVTGTQSGIAVLPGQASVLQIVGLPYSASRGQVLTFTVTLLDTYGNVATGYRGTIHFSSTDDQASLPADYTFTAGDAGSHTFAVVFRTRGRHYLTAADTAAEELQDTEEILTHR
jgi:hypothetical protein